ncbi:UDP-N-acetylmuramoyl-tripeptide--D-alanyl-D-alanine ligase [Catenovulum sediminis]|uniref:UDP-N-acetylmuramoyl-tripeptide--D-alanyl-D-alanine ligase n=1 Tax=Catenovulum sediminis TaxID=1740262 RepID=A0ABV1RG26_9ALTE|nr:UDP-N-acetylmuramoyl-tripeptide--D-alanyl-D-alanine ligase [Catenovulum sediminis]
MISVSLGELAQVTGGRLVGGEANIQSICHDSRKVQMGDCYLAIVGERFDGHNFCQSAIEAGAIALIVSTEQKVAVPQLIVDDCKTALGQIGAFNKSRAKVKTVAITGSSGKTTVKEMLAAILKLAGKTLATAGNFNNDIGVPLTLLRLDESYQYAVIELGANHIGEIAYTVNLTQPDVAMVNNVSAAHLEGFGSLAGVIQAKGEIYQGLANNGWAVVNSDLDCIGDWISELSGRKQLSYSRQPFADVYARNVVIQDDLCPQFEWVYQGQTYPVKLNIPGQHNVNNAMAAISCALCLGIDKSLISQGLTETVAVAGRVKPIELGKITLIDDSYNANQGSMLAAIDLLKSAPGARYLIMGDMAEMGQYAEEVHQAVGVYAKEASLEGFYVKGNWVKKAQENPEFQFNDFELLAEKLLSEINEKINSNNKQKVTVLIKGSRSAGMEQLVTLLKEKCGVQAQC